MQSDTVNKHQVVVAPMSRNDIREITSTCRRVLSLPDKSPFPILHFIENVLLDIDPKFEFIVCDKFEMGSREGVTIPSKHLMKIRQDVYIGATEYGNPRDLFTMAHELAHYILHTPSRVELTRMNGKVQAFRDPEWQANTFAAELLCPSDVARTMEEEEIINVFGVSKTVAHIQQNTHK